METYQRHQPKHKNKFLVGSREMCYIAKETTKG